MRTMNAVHPHVVTVKTGTGMHYKFYVLCANKPKSKRLVYNYIEMQTKIMEPGVSIQLVTRSYKGGLPSVSQEIDDVMEIPIKHFKLLL
jgi:hypothetical protein